MPARTGKIARLPARIREELNLRLLDGQAASQILPWLNGLDWVKRVIEEDHEGLMVNDKNLSDWRLGGYADWLRRREQVDQVKELSKYAVQIAKANGGNLSEGAASILSGNILGILEEINSLARGGEAETPEESAKRVATITAAVEGLTLSLARLRKGDHNALQLRLNQQRVAQSAESLKLERDKYETLVCGKLLAAAALDKVREIAKRDIPNADKIAVLRKEFFSDVDALEKSGEIKLPE